MKKTLLTLLFSLVLSSCLFSQGVAVEQFQYGDRNIVRFTILDLPDFFGWTNHDKFVVYAANYEMGPPGDWNWVQKAESTRKDPVIYMSVLRPLEGDFWFVVEGSTYDGSFDYQGSQFVASFGAAPPSLKTGTIPWIAVDGGWETCLVLTNPNDYSITAVLKGYSLYGGAPIQESIELSSHSSFARYIFQGHTFYGSLKIESSDVLQWERWLHLVDTDVWIPHFGETN